MRLAPCAETAHIAELVRGQKTTKKRAKPASMPNPVKRLTTSSTQFRPTHLYPARLVSNTHKSHPSYASTHYRNYQQKPAFVQPKRPTAPVPSQSVKQSKSVFSPPPAFSPSSPFASTLAQTGDEVQAGLPVGSSSAFTESNEPSRIFLRKLAEQKNLPAPVFLSYTTTTRSNKIIYFARVEIRDENWTSHPEVCYSPEDAEDAASKKAIETLQSRVDPILCEGVHKEEDHLDLIQSIVKVKKITLLFFTLINIFFFCTDPEQRNFWFR